MIPLPQVITLHKQIVVHMASNSTYVTPFTPHELRFEVATGVSITISNCTTDFHTVPKKNRMTYEVKGDCFWPSGGGNGNSYLAIYWYTLGMMLKTRASLQMVLICNVMKAF